MSEKHLMTLRILTIKPVHIRNHYNDVIMSAIASQIIRLTNVYSTVYSDANQRKHQSSASLAFKRGIHRWPVNSPHKGPATQKMFPFDDVIANSQIITRRHLEDGIKSINVSCHSLTQYHNDSIRIACLMIYKQVISTDLSTHITWPIYMSTTVKVVSILLQRSEDYLLSAVC